VERVVIEMPAKEGAGDGPRLTEKFQTTPSGRLCLQVAKNEEDGFIPEIAGSPLITVASCRAERGDRQLPKAIPTASPSGPNFIFTFSEARVKVPHAASENDNPERTFRGS
jgi:hypothetical protein